MLANGFTQRCIPSLITTDEQVRKVGRKEVLCNEKSINVKSDRPRFESRRRLKLRADRRLLQ